MSKKTFTAIILIVVAALAGGAAYMRLVLDRQAVDNTSDEPQPTEKLSTEELTASAEALKATTTQTAAQVTAQEKAAEKLKTPAPDAPTSSQNQDALMKAAEALKAK